MRGLRRQIEAIIEDVNHEIRVDLGLEPADPELKTADTPDVPDAEKATEPQEEESEEAKAFGKVLDEIFASFEEETVAEDETENEPGDLEEPPANALEEILNSL